MAQNTPNKGELNFTICELPNWPNLTAKPLTVRAIVDHITRRRCTGAPQSDAERAFLADFAVAEDAGAFIADSFFEAALEGGRTLQEETYSLDDRDETGGWFGLHQ